MLDQRGVAVLLQLFQELSFVHCCQLEGATRGLGNHMQLAQPMTVKVSVDGHHIHRELTSRISDRHSVFDSGNNAFP